MICVLVVASIRIYREGLALMLAQRSAFAIAGAAADRGQTTALLSASRPDVLLLDLTTPESDAIVRDVDRLQHGLPIVALGVGDGEQEVLSCIEAGVAGFVSRDGSFDDLASALEGAARGELRCTPQFAGSLLRRVAALAAARDSAASPERLTIRECEIVRLLEQNLSNKEIAVRLGIEVATVKNHVHNLLEKLQVRRRTDVARRSARAVRPVAHSLGPDRT
jgi:two-component system, NarL family, nitrate/nitrite response regulator NarL